MEENEEEELEIQDESSEERQDTDMVSGPPCPFSQELGADVPKRSQGASPLPTR